MTKSPTPRVPRSTLYDKLVPALLVVMVVVLVLVLLVIVVWPAPGAG